MQSGAKQRGYTLLELTVAVSVMTVVIMAAGPQYQIAFEQARADQCTGVLKSIANAQRLYWLERRTYAEDLDELVTMGFLHRGIPTAADPYTFEIGAAGATSFVATGSRVTSSWEGAITMDETGALSGGVTDGTRSIMP